MKLKISSPIARPQPHCHKGMYLLILLQLALLLSACAPILPIETTPSLTGYLPLTSTPIPGEAHIPAPSPSAVPALSSTSTQARQSLPTEVRKASGLSIDVMEGSGPPYETVISLPVGEGNVQYRGLSASEGLIEGPNALGVFSDGTFGLADPAAGSLLRFSPAGELLNRVELRAVGIHMLSGMAISGNDFLVLEAGFGPDPQVYRIYRVTPSGEVSATYDLPDWARLESGLTGISAWQTGEVFVELGGSRTYLFMTAAGDLAAQPVVAPVGPGNIRLQAPQRNLAYRITTRFTYDLGSVRLLTVNEDGSFFVVREDVIDQQVIRVDQTVHWLDERGEQLGIARMPQDECLYYVPGNLAVGPAGQVYGLIPRQDRLDIVHLIFYQQLDALHPEADIPYVKGYLEVQ